MLETLEAARARLGDIFPRTPGDLTVVLHDGLPGLVLARPPLGLMWLATARDARPFLSGWNGRRELHLLGSGRHPSSRAPERGAACLYARHVIVACNRDLARLMPALRTARELRWAWLLEGAARWFAGETAETLPAIARRLRAGDRPAFPPHPRDAPLLGATVFELLEREHGRRAAVRLATRLHPRGPRAALVEAFGGRSLIHTEGAWRSRLAQLAAAA